MYNSVWERRSNNTLNESNTIAHRRDQEHSGRKGRGTQLLTRAVKDGVGGT